jgi:FkbM family methyltransferase
MRIGLDLASNDYRSGLVERPVQEAIADAMRPGAVFFDVGANVGFFSLVAARASGGTARIVAFEPRADVASALAANARRNSLDITVLAVAAGDQGGTASLLVAEHPGGATTDASKATDTVRITHVPQVAIDDLVDAGTLPVPDVVKIDVEGSETAVVRGMSRTLRRGRTVVVFEVDAPTVAAVEQQYDEVVRLLDELGYTSSRLEPSYVGSGWNVIHAIARFDG